MYLVKCSVFFHIVIYSTVWQRKYIYVSFFQFSAALVGEVTAVNTSLIDGSLDISPRAEEWQESSGCNMERR